MYQIHSKNQCPPRRESTTNGPAIPPCSPCYRCLRNHALQACNFKDAQCHKCKKVGHIAKACKTKQNPQKESCHRARRTHYVDDSPGSKLEEHTPTTTDSSYNLFTITEGSQNFILLQVTINQTPVQMELDTGASSLTNKQTFDVIAGHSHITMRSTDVHLKTYTGEALEILGEADVTFNCCEEKQQLVVYVVAGNLVV